MNALEFRFAFFARDFERSVGFYRDTLGMQPVGEWWDHPDGKGALLSAGGTAVIEVYGAAEGQTYSGAAPTALNLALCFDTPAEVEAWHARLKAAGADIAEPPTDRPWGHRSFIVRDPDGIPIHIYCQLA